MRCNKLSGILEQPAKADKSAPTGIRVRYLEIMPVALSEAKGLA